MIQPMTKKTRTRWLLWAILIALLAALVTGAAWWRRSRRNGPQYQTAAITRGDLTQTVTATGQLNPVVNVTVGCQISGTLAEIYVDYNSPVTNGQIIAQIDPATYRANLQLATADVANATATLELAQVNARRAKELFDSKLIPQSDYDTATASLHQAEAALLNKQASLSRARVDLDRCTIYSPVDGIVISRNVDVGQTVAASLSAPTLFTIANDLTKMQIDANVAEADIGGVTAGQDVEFTVDAFPYRTFHGRVIQVRNAPITVQNVVTYDTVIEVSNPDLKLKPGMTANVSIIIAHRENILKIPNAALRFRPPETTATNTPLAAGPTGTRARGERKTARSLYLLRDGQPQSVPVKIGISDGITTEVLEGLNENDTIIIAATTTKSGGTSPTTNPFGGLPRRF